MLATSGPDGSCDVCARGSGGPEDRLDLDGLPSSAAMLRDHVRGGVTEEAVAARLNGSYTTTMRWDTDG